jgi:hypothetical protein
VNLPAQPIWIEIFADHSIAIASKLAPTLDLQ